MSTPVVYDLSLKDGFSPVIDKANAGVNRLESSLGGVKSLLGGIGVGLAAFKGMEFLNEAAEAWDKMEFSISQVQAALKSTDGAAGLSFEELKKGAEDTAHKLKYTQSEILGMQSILLTFPSVTKTAFGPASDIIADMSTRLGQDLKSSAIQVGKALQDPEHGIVALRRVGVNFNETQTELIKNMVKTGDAAGAQAAILRELQVEFGGSAKAAAEADKSFRLDKTMEENKVYLGEMLDQLKEQLLPTLIKVAEGFKNMLSWINKNAGAIWNITKALGAAWLTFKAISGAQAIISAVSLALEGMAAAGMGATTSLGALGASSTAALGPLGLLAAAIGTVVLAYNMLSDAEDRRKKGDQDLRDMAKKDAEEQLAWSTGVFEKTMAHDAAVAKAKKTYLYELQQQYNELEESINKTDGTGEEYRHLQGRINYIREAMKSAEGYTGLVPSKKASAIAKTGTTPVKDDSKSKATSARAVTINVSIKDLIGTYNSNITNIKEMSADIRQQVVNALTSAVNDFQIVAERS